MPKFKPIEDLIKQSNFTVIGYLSESESVKNELLESINPTNVGEFNQFFDIRSKMRSSKINSIESGSTFSEYFHFNIMDFKESVYKDPKFQNVNNSLNRAQEIRGLSRRLYEMSIKNGSKVIITSPMYNSVDGGLSLRNGHSLVYNANLVFHIVKDEIKIEKNRYGDYTRFYLIDGEYKPQPDLAS
mgnify:CR=1 FL=1